MDFKRLIINKSALKRIFYIYVPVAVAIYLSLLGLSYATDKPSPPLDLAQSFRLKIPVVYHEEYNISFFGMERLHKFDSSKYGKIHQLINDNVLPGTFIQAAPPDRDLLLLAHDPEYLESLNSSFTLARILEVNIVKFFPSRLTSNLVLRPMKYQMGGSLLAAKAALEFGWAINLGGGFHHASYTDGQGFCPLADISLIVKYLRREKLAKKVMIIDLDAHQGNGFERDFRNDEDVYILDVYNKDVYPNDVAAKAGIDLQVELDAFTEDGEYLQKVRNALDKAFGEFTPDIIVYNAGTDVLSGDPFGGLDISPKGVMERDEIVFQKALSGKRPIVMLLSGGYQESNASVVASSINNLKSKFALFEQKRAGAGQP